MPTPSDENLDRALRELRAEYLAAAPERLGELWSSLERVQNDDADGLSELGVRLHRLAGSGGGYGFPAISSTARAASQLCRSLMEADTPPVPSDVLRLRELVQGVCDAFARAQSME